MTGITNLVRKLRQAVTGVEEPAPAAQPFHWEPAPAAPPPGPRSLEPPPAAVREEPPLEQPPAPPAAPVAQRSGAAPQWKRLAPPAASVVGAEIPADVSDFAAVYKGAGVEEPSHGYGVDRVAEMLDHKSLAGLDKSVKASAVLAALDAAGVHVHDVVHDGLLRYKALVAFEAAKELEFHAVGPRNEHRVEQLRLAIAGFQQKKNAELQALTQEATAAVAALNRLKARQRAEEERFHRAISLLVEPLPARVLPMTPKAEASAAEPPDSRPELKLVLHVPPATGAHASAAPAAAGGTAGRALPDVSEPDSLAAESDEAKRPDERPTVKLTPEQMSLIAEADSAAYEAGRAQREQASAPASDEPPASVEGGPADAGAESPTPAEGEASAPQPAPQGSKDPTVRLTAQQAAEIVASFKDTAGAPGVAEAVSAPQPAPQGSKDPTVRLTAQQAAEIVASFKDMAAAAAGGETEAPSPGALTNQDSPEPIVHLTSEQVADLGEASPAPVSERADDAPALPLDSTSLKDRAIRLTAAQTRAILASFAAREAGGPERSGENGERTEVDRGSSEPGGRRDGEQEGQS